MEELDIGLVAPGYRIATSDATQVYGNVIVKPIVGDFFLPPGEGVVVKPGNDILFQMEQYATDVSESVLKYLCRCKVQYADQMTMVITDLVIYYSCLYAGIPEVERQYGTFELYHQVGNSVIVVADLGPCFDNQQRILSFDAAASTGPSVAVH